MENDDECTTAADEPWALVIHPCIHLFRKKGNTYPLQVPNT